MSLSGPAIGLASLLIVAGCTTEFSNDPDGSASDTAGEPDVSLDAPDASEPDMPLDPGIDTDADVVADLPADTHVDTSSDTVADTAADVPVDPVTDDAPVTCDREGYVSTIDAARFSSGTTMQYTGQTTASSPFDLLLIEFYYGFGDPPPLTGPGTYVLATTAVEQNYATCGTCVSIASGCDEVAGTCAKRFFATAGRIDVEEFGAVGEPFSGVASGLTLVEVTIDPDTFLSSPVPGGEGWCIDSYSFDTAMVTL